VSAKPLNLCRGSLRSHGGVRMQREPMLGEQNPHRDEDRKREDQGGAQMQPRRGEKPRGLGSDK